MKLSYSTPKVLFSIFFTALIIVVAGCSQKSIPVSEQENDMYDGPEEAAKMEFERTKDPATGKVPRELLLTAIEKTRLSKLSAQNNPANINALTWQERGSNSDATGPSNENTRANNSITSGRIRAVLVDLTDASGKTVWVGGADGGLWKTTDITVATPAWTLVNDLLSNLAVTSICQDPTATNIMYFCTGEVYGNSDAVNGNGVFKSINGGVTWAQLPSTSAYTRCTKILCDAAGNIYLGTAGSGFLRSTKVSGGGAWTAIQPSGFSLNTADFEISSTGRLHISVGIQTDSLGAYRYTDNPSTVNSGTWSTPASPFPFPLGTYCRVELGCSGNTLYALPSNNSGIVTTIYKSTDGGANWTTIALTATNITDLNGFAWYSLAIDIDPSNASNVIIGNLNCLKSTNGGTTWSKISEWIGTAGQYVHADQQIIKWYDNGNKLLIGCDGGIFYSADKGVTIRDKNTGLRIKQFYSCAIHPTTTNYFLAGAQDNGTHQFNNAGLSSSIEVKGGDGGFVAIDQDQPQYQFGSYTYNDYRRSTDGGATWTNVTLSSTNGQFINPYDYDNTANIMYCGDTLGKFRRWTNPQTGSASEVVAITTLQTSAVSAVSVSPYTANRVFFGTASGDIVQVDGANTIASGSAGTNRSFGLGLGTVSCINFGTNDQNLICCQSNYGIINTYISTNGGANWTGVDGNLPDMPVRWCMFAPGDNTVAFIATETGVWETNLLNGASTVWTANNTFPTVRTDMIKYRSSDRTIAAATHGRGLWTATLPLTFTPDLQFQAPSASATEATASTIDCRGYTDYTGSMTIANPPTGAAIVTLGIAGGGTATQNFDYAITTNGNFATPSMVLNFANGVTTPQPFTVRIYDDAALETAESFTLNYTISNPGSTNAQAGSINQTFVFNIVENDVEPIGQISISGAVGMDNTFIGVPFMGGQFDARTQALYTATELTTLGFTPGNITSLGFNVYIKNSTQPYEGFTIKLKNTITTALTAGAFEAGGTAVYSGNYSTFLGINTIPIIPFFWNGTSNLLVDMCFNNTTATGYDHIRGNSDSGPGNTYYQRQSSNVIPGCDIPNSGYVYNGTRPYITFTSSTSGKEVSTALNSTQTAYLGPNADVCFYDGSGKILARIKNLTSFDYGCTEVTIDRAGNGSTQFWNNAMANNLLQKSIKIVPTNNTASGHYQLTLYYTGTEVTNWQTATGQTISSAQVVKVSNGFFIPDISPSVPHTSDVTMVAGTSAAFGNDYKITGDFNNTGFSGFGVGVPGNPISTANFKTKANGNFTDGAIWQYNNSGASYVDALQAPGSNNSVLIQAAHSVTLNAGFVTNAGKTVTVDGILDCGTNTVSGAGTFTLSPAGTLGIGSLNGISAAAATGNILVTGLRTFPVTANYTYNGSSNQSSGNGLPATINNLVIANTGVAPNNIFSLEAPLTINGTTTLTSGILAIGSNTLTLKGTTTYGTGIFRGSSTSNLTIAGTVGTINFDQSAAANRTLNNLIITGAGSSGISGSLILTAKSVTLTPGAIFTVPTGNVLETN